MKRCSGCGLEKDLTEFHRAKANKDGLCGQCKICRCAYTVQYNSLHPQEIKDNKLQWQRANRSKLNFKERDRYHADIDRSRMLSRSRQEGRKERKAEYTHQRRLANLEKERERCRIWDKQNQQMVADRQGRRRARKKNLTVEMFSRIEIFERDQWVCQLCNKNVDSTLKYPNPLSSSLDHIIPISRNGTHERKNTQLAHLICNQISSANLK